MRGEVLTLDRLITAVAEEDRKREATQVTVQRRDGSVVTKRKRVKNKTAFKQGSRASMQSVISFRKQNIRQVRLIDESADSSTVPLIDRLDLSQNKIESLKSSNLDILASSLKHLVLSNNQLTDLDVSKFVNLEFLDVRNNQLTRIRGLWNCRRTLHTLLLNNNQLSDLFTLFQPPKQISSKQSDALSSSSSPSSSSSKGSSNANQNLYQSLTVLSLSSNPLIDAGKLSSQPDAEFVLRKRFNVLFFLLPRLQRFVFARCCFNNMIPMNNARDSESPMKNRPSLMKLLLTSMFKLCRKLTEVRLNGNGITDQDWFDSLETSRINQPAHPKQKGKQIRDSLTVLDLGSNRLFRLEKILKSLVKCFDHLTNLRLYGNPLCDASDLRNNRPEILSDLDSHRIIDYNIETVLTFLPKLITFDMKKVSNLMSIEIGSDAHKKIADHAREARRLKLKNDRDTVVVLSKAGEIKEELRLRRAEIRARKKQAIMAAKIASSKKKLRKKQSSSEGMRSVKKRSLKSMKDEMRDSKDTPGDSESDSDDEMGLDPTLMMRRKRRKVDSEEEGTMVDEPKDEAESDMGDEHNVVKVNEPDTKEEEVDFYQLRSQMVSEDTRDEEMSSAAKPSSNGHSSAVAAKSAVSSPPKIKVIKHRIEKQSKSRKRKSIGSAKKSSNDATTAKPDALQLLLGASESSRNQFGSGVSFWD